MSCTTCSLYADRRVSGGAWWGGTGGLGSAARTVLLVAAGCVPLAIQLITGHGLDSAWVARFTKSGSPGQYRRSLAFSVAAAVASCLGAWLFLAGPRAG